MIAPQLRLREVMRTREARDARGGDGGVRRAPRRRAPTRRGRELRGIYDERIQSKSERGRRMAELKEKIAVDFAASDAVPGHTAEQLDAAFRSQFAGDARFDLRINCVVAWTAAGWRSSGIWTRRWR